MGVSVGGWTISLRVVLIGSLSLMLWNNYPTSAFAAEDMKNFVILERVSTHPLISWVLWKSLKLRVKFPPAQFLALISDN